MSSTKKEIKRLFAEERKQQILHVLQRAPAVRVADLGQSLGASVASIRRDLADLQRSGLLKRTHGGAISNTLAMAELSLAAKTDRYQPEKAAIAAMAARLIDTGDTVLLDSGSTTREIALKLRHRRRISVVTNALNIGWELASSDVELVLTGGHIRPGILSQVGPIAEQSIAGLHVDKLFLAANGVDLDKGITTPNLVEAQTKRAMIESAGEIILVADHSKFGRVTFGHICGLDRIHTIITDEGVPNEVAAAIEQRGIKVHIVAVSRPPGTPAVRLHP
jgi:DeoR family fructose operon transcriptional repressor